MQWQCGNAHWWAYPSYLQSMAYRAQNAGFHVFFHNWNIFAWLEWRVTCESRDLISLTGWQGFCAEADLDDLATLEFLSADVYISLHKAYRKSWKIFQISTHNYIETSSNDIQWNQSNEHQWTSSFRILMNIEISSPCRRRVLSKVGRASLMSTQLGRPKIFRPDTTWSGTSRWIPRFPSHPWLVVEPPLWKIGMSIGMMTGPQLIWENNPVMFQENHQPDCAPMYLASVDQVRLFAAAGSPSASRGHLLKLDTIEEHCLLSSTTDLFTKSFWNFSQPLFLLPRKPKARTGVSARNRCCHLPLPAWAAKLEQRNAIVAM